MIIEGEYKDLDDKMENKFNILTEFIKDMSCETKNAQTYLHVKDVIKNYHLRFCYKSNSYKK